MIDGPFRKWLPSVSGPVIGFYRFLRLTPNMISSGALGLGVGAAIACAFGYFYTAILLWWLGRLLDGTDGIYARATGQTSEFGAYFDILCDMAAYSAMVIGLAVAFPAQGNAWLTIMFFYVLCITSALALGNLENKLGKQSNDNRGLRLGTGLAEGGETGIAYTVFLLFPSAVPWTTTLWIIILLITVVARTLLARSLVHSSK